MEMAPIKDQPRANAVFVLSVKAGAGERELARTRRLQIEMYIIEHKVM